MLTFGHWSPSSNLLLVVSSPPKDHRPNVILGDCLAKHDINLVYGSGKEGLMGLVAKQVFEGGCEVLGVVPEFIWEKFMEDQETYGDILVVDSMHTRKKAMFDKADGFISVPGGFGTLDETIEMITWHQLDLHKKPIGVLNISNYFDPLLKWVENAVEKGFVPQHVMDILVVSDNPEVLLKKDA